jgi:hypothetical protein
VLKVADGRRGSCCNSTDAKGGTGTRCARCDVSEVSEVRLERGAENPLRLSEVRLKAWRRFAFPMGAPLLTMLIISISSATC